MPELGQNTGLHPASGTPPEPALPVPAFPEPPLPVFPEPPAAEPPFPPLAPEPAAPPVVPPSGVKIPVFSLSAQLSASAPVRAQNKPKVMREEVCATVSCLQSSGNLSLLTGLTASPNKPVFGSRELAEARSGSPAGSSPT